MEASTTQWSLFVDRAARTVIVEGRQIDLPPTQFELLVTLAAHHGQVFSADELLDRVWRNSVGMTQQDVRKLVQRLRTRIGDRDRERPIVGNRYGYGYFIDLPREAVHVSDSPDETDPGEMIVLEAPEDTEAFPQPDPLGHTVVLEREDQSEESPSSPPHTRPFRLKIVLGAAFLACLLLASSWAAGVWLGQRRSDGPVTPQDRGGSETGEADFPDSDSKDKKGSRKDSTSRKDRRAPVTGSQAGASTAASVNTTGGGETTSQKSDNTSRPKGHANEPASPPLPDAQLFQLHDPASDDYYATTSASAANQKQAEGYEMVIVGRVFTSAVKGTVAIAIDDGAAYVYRDAASAPDGLNVTALYRLAKGGHVFYTTSVSEASQAQAQGWGKTIAGYVAA
jgi:DNA-binding winged helix-turn-helix (wHTH) protein